VEPVDFAMFHEFSERFICRILAGPVAPCGMPKLIEGVIR
jgi:hypothetical protein